MFTGIIECTGSIESVEPVETGAVFWVKSAFAQDTEIGESVAVNGACLTVTEKGDDAMRFDILQQTLKITNLGDLQAGQVVNLERSLQVGDRLSGHFVQGHVDGCGLVRTYEKSGQDHRLVISIPQEFQHLLAPKGSISINGTSLTVAEINQGEITLWIIPHTHEITSLSSIREGDRVNLEFDMIAKHVAQLLPHLTSES